MWKPLLTDPIRIIPLLISAFLAIAGVVMLAAQLNAEGSIGLKSTWLEGSITSGSAGLFCIFFAVVLALFVVARKPTEAHTLEVTPSEADEVVGDRLKYRVKVLAIAWVSVVTFLMGTAFLAVYVHMAFLLFFVMLLIPLMMGWDTLDRLLRE